MVLFKGVFIQMEVNLNKTDFSLYQLPSALADGKVRNNKRALA